MSKFKLGSDESLLPGSQVAVFLQCPHMIEGKAVFLDLLEEHRSIS